MRLPSSAASVLRKLSTVLNPADHLSNRVVALSQLCDKSPGLRHAPICHTQFLFIAGTTHLLTVVQTNGVGQKAEHAREALDSCVDSLRSTGLGHTTAALCATLLVRLIDEWTGSPMDAEATSPGVSQVRSLSDPLIKL